MTDINPFIDTIAELDTMCDNGAEVYFNVGRIGLDVCKRILAGREPKRIIDFPVGYGRVLRWFKHEWPSAEIFAVETDPKALEFVKLTFGAKSVLGHPKLEMNIPGDADLIFSGSLLTHFDEWQWDRFFKMCVDALAPDGTLIFTTHGRAAAMQAKDNKHYYGELIDASNLYAQFKRIGFSFQPYSKDYPEFGVSLSSPEWIVRKLQALPLGKIVYFEEQAWGQDVFAVRRNPWPMTVD